MESCVKIRNALFDGRISQIPEVENIYQREYLYLEIPKPIVDNSKTLAIKYHLNEVKGFFSLNCLNQDPFFFLR